MTKGSRVCLCHWVGWIQQILPEGRKEGKHILGPNEFGMGDAPGSVAETMAPKNRQSVKKKSPASCPTCFISITQPYIINLMGEQKPVGHGVTWTHDQAFDGLTSHPMTKHEITVPTKAYARMDPMLRKKCL